MLPPRVAGLPRPRSPRMAVSPPSSAREEDGVTAAGSNCGASLSAGLVHPPPVLQPETSSPSSGGRFFRGSAPRRCWGLHWSATATLRVASLPRDTLLLPPATATVPSGSVRRSRSAPPPTNAAVPCCSGSSPCSVELKPEPAVPAPPCCRRPLTQPSRAAPEARRATLR